MKKSKPFLSIECLVICSYLVFQTTCLTESPSEQDIIIIKHSSSVLLSHSKDSLRLSNSTSSSSSLYCEANPSIFIKFNSSINESGLVIFPLKDVQVTRPTKIPISQLSLSFPSINSYMVTRSDHLTDRDLIGTLWSLRVAHIREGKDDSQFVEWESTNLCTDAVEASFAQSMLVVTNQSNFSFAEFGSLLNLSNVSDKHTVRRIQSGRNMKSMKLPNATVKRNNTTTEIHTTTVRTTQRPLKHDANKTNLKSNKSKPHNKNVGSRGIAIGHPRLIPINAVPPSQLVYQTFRLSRAASSSETRSDTSQSLGNEQKESHRDTTKRIGHGYAEELEAAAFRFLYFVGFGGNCSETTELVRNMNATSLSTDNSAQNKKSVLEIVEFYMSILYLKCHNEIIHRTVRLFEVEMLRSAPFGYEVEFVTNHPYVTMPILTYDQFEDLISALYFASFSKSYSSLVDDTFQDISRSTPSGKTISTSATLITSFTINLIELICEMRKPLQVESIIQYHLIKITSRLLVILKSYYINLLNEGKHVCNEGEISQHCKSLSRVKFNNLIQVAGLIHFVYHNFNDFDSWLIQDQQNISNDHDNYDEHETNLVLPHFEEHFRQNLDNILQFVRQSIGKDKKSNQ